ncbi:LTA synthase family protein [Limosilactobacillus caccae]|uniref:LTA synthase family protein n=1 Tax=Limosilactobacillus caccae TaxID=1926284 RepID=UPI0009702C89|nr:LTA synthase family protein [Limosilactobacillus caccae]
MKSHHLSWPLLGTVLLWIINAVIWSPQLPYANYNHLNSQMLVIQLTHSLTIIAALIVTMVVGDQLSRTTASLAQTIKYWLYTVGVMMLTILVVWLGFNRFIYHDFYHALLPITGNTVPLAAAMIIASLALPRLRPVIAKAPFTWAMIPLVCLAITSFFSHDPFGLLNGKSISFYLLVMVLGVAGSQIKAKKLNIHKWTLSFLIVNCYLVMVMPDAAYYTHGTLETANRFTIPASLTMVATALGLFLLWQKNIHRFVSAQRHRNYWLLTMAIFVENPVTQKIVVQNAAKSTQLGEQLLWAIGWGIIILALAWKLPAIYNRLQQRLEIAAKVDAFWTVDQAAPVDKQLASHLKRVQHWLFTKWPTILALLCCYVLALASIYLMGRPSLFVKQSMLWFNTFLIFLIFKFIQGLTNRYWVALLTTIIINGIWIIANIQKMTFRNEPILPSELAMIADADSLLGMVSPRLVVECVITIVLFVAAMFALEKRIIGQRVIAKHRICWIIITVCVFASSFGWNQHNSRLQTFVSGWGDVPHFIHQSAGARRNGPLVQFLNNVDITIMNQPSGYSAAEMKRISDHYQEVAAQINKGRTNKLSEQTIIFNLSESFANPNRVPGVSLKNNPIPNIDKIKQDTTSGLMVSSGYGGGTANMEYMTLTGYAMCNFAQTLSTPYTQLVPYLKHNPTIVQSFNHAAAIHPYSKKFYDRGIDYPKFGFNSFSYLGNKKHPIRHQHKIDNNTYLSDETAYANTLDQLKRYPGGQFINLVTMQNHLPYNQLYKHLDQFTATVPDNGTIAAQVENYAVGIHYTDKAVAKFIKEIDNIDRPITLVFYGDHLPGIYRNSMKKDGLKLHETDYFIYSNPAARKQGAKKLTKSTNYVGPNDFIAMAAEQTNSKVTPYQALLTQLFHQLPAYAVSTHTDGTNSYNSAPEFINQQGEVVSYKSLSKKQKQLWHDYQLVQYDLTAGRQYLLKYKMMK